VIVEPPSIGSTTDERGNSRPVSIEFEARNKVSMLKSHSKLPWYPNLLFQRENALASF
jgi:hypothetical protein